MELTESIITDILSKSPGGGPALVVGVAVVVGLELIEVKCPALCGWLVGTTGRWGLLL